MKTISQQDIEKLVEKSRAEKRRRAHLVLSKPADSLQRFLMAMQPDTYVRPHVHNSPEKIELFIWVKGRTGALFFNGKGELIGKTVLEEKGSKIASTNEKGSVDLTPGRSASASCRVAEVHPGTFHTLVCLEPDSVVFEVKAGQYNEGEDKEFADWAPEEFSEGSKEFLEKLKAEF